MDLKTAFPSRFPGCGLEHGREIRGVKINYKT